ncbi:prepilin-type N-terminal cleavage/methylation domain-containing protein [Rhodanobacter sp. FW510-R12]|nr:prepilin-type N-terminal cleavage/methylation domain-containing protein [Rhodanobacter sp. FW104-R8]KZC25438.1 prepilin-type N-terminal cleavage/methylation domain-containing protein [Rhodanobacter sp. FW510-T8]KZC31569.1 prepilin-type N-terminal cleavage/methylation domain-containing protein [Rhodanobacter sp. FW510-R10]
MIAMLLGLIVIGGVVSVFLANQQSYRTNQALGEVQDGSRTAFEMMAQDIRNAGLIGCDSGGDIANVLANKGTAWWANWNNAMKGYGSAQADPAAPSGTGAGQRATGDSLELIGATNSGLSVLSDNHTTTLFTLNETSPDLLSGDVMIVCDPGNAAVFQSSSYSSTAKTVGYDAPAGTPGNSSKILGATGTPYTFGANALIAKLTAVDWYIGNTPGVAGGLSLYRVRLVNNAGSIATTADEMVRNVTDMSIKYLQSGNASFGAASTITNWGAVTAVQVQLTLQSTNQNAGTDAKPITRIFTATTTARNRVN